MLDEVPGKEEAAEMATVESRAKGPYPTPYAPPADPPMGYKMYIGGEWV